MQAEKSNLKLIKTAIILLIPFLLTACSTGPSESEIKTVFDRDLRPQIEQAAKMLESASNIFGVDKDKPVPKITLEVKKVGCKADGDNAFMCDVEILGSNGEKNTSKVVPMRFVKTSSGWKTTN